MAAASSSPPARGLGSLLGIVWEREGRWVIRARADRLAMRAVAFVACLLGLVALVAAGGPLLKIGAPILAGLAVLSLVLGRRSEGGGEILWGPSQILVDGRSLPLARIRSVVFLTALQVHRGRHATSAVQLWRLELTAAGVAGPLLLAAHPNEYALLQAGRRIATALGVPWRDACGPEGSLTTRDSAPAPPRGRESSAGTEFSFRVQRGGAIALALLTAAGIAAVAMLVPFDRGPREWAPAISLLVLVPAFLGSALAARDHGWFRVVIEGGSARVHRPLRFARRLPRDQIQEVRLSTRLRPSPKPPPRPTVISVDLLDGAGRPLVRLPVSPAEAPALAEGLQKALEPGGGAPRPAGT